MNAAARLLKKNTISPSWVFSVLFSRSQLSLSLLVLALFLSALSIVYVTNVTRSLNARLQKNSVEQQQLHVQAGQLLLERSALLTQTRIQQVASNQHAMVVPDNHSVMIINE